MKLTATPFDPQTGELLPVYRDAYLRGDLARTSAQAVEHYLRRDASEAHSTVTRWHQLHTTDEVVTAPTWVQKQMRFMREQPLRFRRRALSLVTVGALLASASMAATRSAELSEPAMNRSTAPSAEVAATSLRTVLVHGRILNEKGQPLAGATVLRKGTAYGTSTDAAGNYSLRVPADAHATLQYGYGGYAEQELPAAAGATPAITLHPRAAKRHRWLFF